MLTFLVRRTLIGSVTLLLITFLIFGLIRNIPGTPLTVAISETDPSRKISPEDLERMSKSYGLDKPWYLAYIDWIGGPEVPKWSHSYARDTMGQAGIDTAVASVSPGVYWGGDTDFAPLAHEDVLTVRRAHHPLVNRARSARVG